MFDKYKRYRERQREGRVAVKVEYRLLLRQLYNLPLNITEVSATLSRVGKIVKLPTRPAEGGSAVWSEPVTVVCTIYRDAVKADACELKAYRLSVSGSGPLEKATVTGHADLDVASHAFRGSGEQQLSLTLPIKLSKHGKEVGQDVDATVDASITSRVIQRGEETEAASRQASGAAAAVGAAASTSSYSIASGLTSEGSQQPDQDLSAPEQQEATTTSAVTTAANKGGRRGRRNDPGPKDRTKSASRIAHAQRRLKERAAMLAKPAGNDLQPLGQGPPPTAGRQGADVEPGDEEAARQLWAHPLSNLPERAPSRPGATEAAAPLERVSPLGDIVLDAATLHIPSMAEPESDVRGAYALPGSRLAPVRTRAESSEELSDGTSTGDSSVASELVADRGPRQPRSSGLVTGAVSLWDKGWAALVPSKGTPSHKQGSQDPVTVVPSELVLRTQSDIISTFGRGGAAAKSPAAPHPPPLPESELPYSSSSEDVAESDASSLAHETDHAAEVDAQVDNSSLLRPHDAARDEAHMQRIAAAASTLRTARLSMQASNQKYHLEPSSRTSSLERPLAARAVQRRPSNLSRGTAGPTLAAADLGSASGPPPPPSEAGSCRRLLKPPAQSRTPTKRQQRLDRVHGKARIRKAMAEEGKQDEERAEDDKQQDLSEDRQSIQQVVLEVADSTRGMASRAERVTEEVIRLAAVMEERRATSERRVSRSTQSPRATMDQPQSSVPRLEPPQAAKPSNSAHPCNTATQAPSQGVAAAASSGANITPTPVSWETNRDQRKLRELQLELQLAEERIAFLESSDNPPSVAGNHLRRSLNRNSSVHRLSRTSSWKGPQDLSATLTGTRELKLSEELQQVRTCLAALRDQTSPSAGPGVLSLEEVQVALAGAELHAAAAKELAELLKMDVLGSGSSPVEAHQFSSSLAELGRKAAVVGSEERNSSHGFKKPSGTESLIRQLSTNMTSDLLEKQRSASTDARSAELARLALELKTAQDLLKAAQQEKQALAEQRDQWQANGRTAEAQQEESLSNSDQHGGEQRTHVTELQREVSALREQLRQQDEDAGALQQLLEPVSPGSASALQDARPLQRVTDQLQVLLQQHSRLQVDNARLLHAPPTAEKGKASEFIAQLQREVAAGTLTNQQLHRDLELMKRENGEDATGMAVKVAVAAKDADIAHMQRQLAELEEQAQAELGDMHEELLEMRQACHALELALNESEIKRNKMLLEKQQMEQQLQETAGELVEVERELNRQRAPQGSPTHKDPQGGKLPRIVAAEDAGIGPHTPPALHPGRVRHTSSEEAPEAGHIVLAGGALMAYDTLRRDFDSVMQELVQRKLELAELSEDYERVCHAFLRADEANNAPVLANLKLRGSLAPVSLNADAR